MAKTKMNLHKLLDTVELCHKNDIHDYTLGHLNESRSQRKMETANRQSWATAEQDPVVMTQKHVFVKSATRSGKEARSKMNNVLYDFTMGTSGTIPKTASMSAPSPRYLARPTPISKQRSNSIYSQLAEDGVYIEELRPQELLLPTPRSQRTTPWGGKERGQTDTPPSSLPSPSPRTRYLHSDLTTSEHMAVLSHYCGATKKDQYKKLKEFEHDILKTQDSSEQKVLSGTKAVDHLQKQLDEELSNLHFNGVGPNFHKLQVHSNVFDNLIDESPTFKYILSCIKTEYDNYIGKLLDGQTSQHRLLQEQVEKMSNRGTSRPAELDKEKERLLSLEDQARTLLDENERLRNELEYETKLQENTPSEPEVIIPPIRLFKSDQPVEIAEEVEHVKALILEKMDELNSLRNKLRDDFVPSTVCTHLEQCIKESEVEVQKLLKQNEYFEKSISDLDTELKQAIVTADTSERDARRIWRRVNSTRPLGSARSSSTLRTMTTVGETLYESEEDEDDESKWNWYIS